MPKQQSMRRATSGPNSSAKHSLFCGPSSPTRKNARVLQTRKVKLVEKALEDLGEGCLDTEGRTNSSTKDTPTMTRQPLMDLHDVSPVLGTHGRDLQEADFVIPSQSVATRRASHGTNERCSVLRKACDNSRMAFQISLDESLSPNCIPEQDLESVGDFSPNVYKKQVQVIAQQEEIIEKLYRIVRDKDNALRAKDEECTGQRRRFDRNLSKLRDKFGAQEENSQLQQQIIVDQELSLKQKQDDIEMLKSNGAYWKALTHSERASYLDAIF